MGEGVLVEQCSQASVTQSDESKSASPAGLLALNHRGAQQVPVSESANMSRFRQFDVCPVTIVQKKMAS